MMEDSMYHLVDHARKSGTRPRVHGNGFIQLDLSPNVRLHVWGHRAIPRQTVETPIHNHQFSFTSLVLKGTMVNQKYFASVTNHLLGEATHHVYTARVREGEDTILVDSGQTAVLYTDNQDIVSAGDHYSMTKGEIHESIVKELTVTVIMKVGKSLAQGGLQPTVYVPLGITPDNDFNRYTMKPSDLWGIIYESL
jgi:hypothetical protein